MKKFGLAFVGVVFGMAIVAGAEEATPLQETKEIIGVLKSRYVDSDRLDSQRLTDATVGGLLKSLGGGAQILSADEAKTNAAPVAVTTGATSNGTSLARAEIVEPDIGYIRIADVEAATVTAFDHELKKFTSKKVKDYLLDLRFADGTNYAAVAEIAGRFLKDGPELFSIKRADRPAQVFRAKTGDAAPDKRLAESPLIVLVNPQTRGAAEALAGVLQAQQRGMVIGNRTAGNALEWEDFPISGGRVLRVATSKVALPKGDVFPGGIKPDIAVRIDSKIEQDAVLNTTNTTLSASLQTAETHKGMKEADLVKYHRGEAFDMPISKSSTNKTAAGNEAEKEKEPPVVRDVVLQRAVDILKGLRVWNSWL